MRLLGRRARNLDGCSSGCYHIHGRLPPKRLRKLKRRARRQEAKAWRTEASQD